MTKEAVVLLDKPYKANKEAAQGALEVSLLVMMKQGWRIPIISQELYSDEVRADAQERIRENYVQGKRDSCYQLNAMDRFQLKEGFAPLEEVCVASGTQFDDLINRLNREYGHGNYSLDSIPEIEQTSFSVYVRYVIEE